MRLAVEITTCMPRRTGIGYYTEHLVDALLATMGRNDDVVLISNREPAPELALRWAPHLRRSGPDVRAAWMQVGAPRLLAEAEADVAVFPNYAVPLASPCPTIVIVHDLAVLRMPDHATLQKRLLWRPMLEQVEEDRVGHRHGVGGVAVATSWSGSASAKRGSRSCPARRIRRVARPVVRPWPSRAPGSGSRSPTS